MIAKVDKDSCIGCGMCIDICPEIFQYDDEYKSESVTEKIPEELKEKVAEAIDVCPVEAISEDNSL